MSSGVEINPVLVGIQLRNDLRDIIAALAQIATLAPLGPDESEWVGIVDGAEELAVRLCGESGVLLHGWQVSQFMAWYARTAGNAYGDDRGLLLPRVAALVVRAEA